MRSSGRQGREGLGPGPSAASDADLCPSRGLGVPMRDVLPFRRGGGTGAGGASPFGGSGGRRVCRGLRTWVCRLGWRWYMSSQE